MTDRDSPRRRTDMREPANKRLITVVSRLAPTVARSSHNNFSRVFGEGGLWLRPTAEVAMKRKSIARPAQLRARTAARKLGYRIGRLDDDDVLRLNRALLIHFGLPV